MAYQPPRRVGLEEIFVIAQHPLDGAVSFLEGHFQIGLTRLLLDVVLLNLQPPHTELGPRWRQEKTPRPELVRAVRFLQCERDLHQRCAAGIALHLQTLHQQRERIILVFQTVENCGTDALKQGGEWWIARQVGAKGQHVDEIADHIFKSGTTPASEGAADQKILLPSVPAELYLKRG